MFKICKDKMVGFEIKTVHNLLKRDFESLPIHDKIKDVTGMQKWIIGYLSDNNEKDIFQKDLEEEFSIRRSTATGILQLLEKNNLITRQPVSYDARLKKIVLTQKALNIQDEINEEIKVHEEKISKDISKDDLEIFFKVMEQIRVNLGE
ncbi:MarR family winged helix-turn-helix transcriptional regulator [Terrisporobacter sp.]